MSTKREWIERLVKRAADRKERIDALTKNGAELMNQLRLVTQSDIDGINQELSDKKVSETREAFYVFTAGEFAFEIRHASESYSVKVILEPEHELLVCELTHQRPMELKAKVFPNGNVRFIGEGELILSELPKVMAKKIAAKSSLTTHQLCAVLFC